MVRFVVEIPIASATRDFMSMRDGFGVGFVMRPVGAIVIGSYADRAGRKCDDNTDRDDGARLQNHRGDTDVR
jgi:hypothetical protein